MRFSHVAFGFALVILSHAATAANTDLITVTSGSKFREFNSAQEHQRVEVQVQAESYRTLARAYIACKKSGGMGYLRIPAKKAACRLQEHRPRGSHLGSCSFEGTAYCVTREMLDSQDEARLGTDLSDVIAGRRSMQMPDGTLVDFSDIQKEMN